MTASFINMHGLSLKLAGRQVLDNIDLAFPAGQLIALLGPNGAGKTTLLRCLAGLLQPDAGQITINDTNIHSLERMQRARLLTYLEQDADCHWPMAVEDVVALGRLPHHIGGNRLAPDCRQQIDQAIEESDLLSLRHRSVDELSGGERRRVMLARSLATEARVLLADEPVSGLDPAHQLRMMSQLVARADAGMSVIVVLHDLSLAARYCERLVMLNAGRVVADGTAAEVLTPERLSATYGIRARVDMLDGIRVVVPISEI